MKVFEQLNTLAHLTPDEIAAKIGDPFATWRWGKSLTEAEYDKYSDTEIAVLHYSYPNRPSRAETEHRLGNWDYSTWRDWLGQDFYFRSQESFDDNPDEPVAEATQHERRRISG